MLTAIEESRCHLFLSYFRRFNRSASMLHRHYSSPTFTQLIHVIVVSVRDMWSEGFIVKYGFPGTAKKFARRSGGSFPSRN